MSQVAQALAEDQLRLSWEVSQQQFGNGPGGETNFTIDRLARMTLPELRRVLRVFPPCALIAHAQGSSGVVDNMPFAWRGHTKRLATRARPSPDLAVWLE